MKSKWSCKVGNCRQFALWGPVKFCAAHWEKEKSKRELRPKYGIKSHFVLIPERGYLGDSAWLDRDSIDNWGHWHWVAWPRWNGSLRAVRRVAPLHYFDHIKVEYVGIPGDGGPRDNYIARFYEDEAGHLASKMNEWNEWTTMRLAS